MEPRIERDLSLGQREPPTKTEYALICATVKSVLPKRRQFYIDTTPYKSNNRRRIITVRLGCLNDNPDWIHLDVELVEETVPRICLMIIVGPGSNSPTYPLLRFSIQRAEQLIDNALEAIKKIEGLVAS